MIPPIKTRIPKNLLQFMSSNVAQQENKYKNPFIFNSIRSPKGM